MPNSPRASPPPATPPSTPKRPYRGRFAPSPSGPLHLGSLIAAVASYLDARSNRGIWLVRMDDLDPPREVPGAAHSILDSLSQHGLHWDEDVLWQSQRGEAYQRALQQLQAQTFNCDCSRKALAATGVCQRDCRSRQGEVTTPAAIRMTVPRDGVIGFDDTLQGSQHIALGQTSADFLIHRKDGLYAYQLAVVVDDAHQGITHIVRGSDLLDTTARQIFLQQALDYPTPIYSHVPVITNSAGQKFSKQHHATALADRNAVPNLRSALKFLCQPRPPAQLASPAELLQFAVQNWAPRAIPSAMAIVAGRDST